MLQSSIAFALIRTIPEGILLMLSIYILLDLKLEIDKILKNGILFGIIVTIIRKLPITFGVHSLLSMVVLGLILFKISSKNLMEVIIALCDAWIALALSEGIYYVIATSIFSISSSVLTNYKSIQGALSTLPSLGIFLLLVFVVKSMKRKMMRRF